MNMDTAIVELLETIRADYRGWTEGHARRPLTEHTATMIEEFDNSLSVEPGRKYIKIVSRGSVWGFIVATDKDAKFPRGTILKAAGWNTPARNHSRGNVLDGGYTIKWTGPLYMN